ncbi:hypothetical protein A3K86_11735 [Photobacterium jeanii]|uniref:Type II secretion system protein H n=1 Tax=Photobacterium jeanii TaxID=858640 RepID=A0A178KC39_9GAMM|nr:GspH/FimT family pseudopilin [Photobacterium jeanii]OAN14242.1 hypothetical protein A3K86_11735 [Photobacterium jeanii]PST89763.1 hypothetical protein C9I91_12350 [Photobacterium jeanii]
MQNHKRNVGFTLIELVTVTAVVIILIAAAAPSFASLIEKEKLKRLAVEIEWLLVLSKSESVMRGNDVIVNIESVPSSLGNNKTWSITAKDKVTNHIVAEVNGQDFSGVNVSQTFTKTKIDFDSLTGRPNINGSFVFNSKSNKNNIKVTISNMTGRIYTCSELGDYGYGKCPNKA